MAKKKENLKEMTAADLGTKLRGLEESLRVLRFKTEGAKSKNVKEAFLLKKEIARVLTEINKKK